jgi:NADH-dependent fumarate reductase subunit E
MSQYALHIDHDACWGCKTCEVACKQEIKTAFGTRLISVSEKVDQKAQEQFYFTFQVNVCRHCDDPPCMAVCPEQAISKRRDGIVVLYEGRCSGCTLCIDACPHGAIAFDKDKRVAQKCNLCHHRVDNGLIPACADNICLAHCIHFVEHSEDKKIPAHRK